MSTSGIYNYRPKVEHPNKEFIQMTSGGFQPPFFFGGSQVPLATGQINGKGMHTPYESAYDMKRKLPMTGRGIQTTAKKGSKIYLPTGKC